MARAPLLPAHSAAFPSWYVLYLYMLLLLYNYIKRRCSSSAVCKKAICKYSSRSPRLTIYYTKMSLIHIQLSSNYISKRKRFLIVLQVYLLSSFICILNFSSPFMLPRRSHTLVVVHPNLDLNPEMILSLGHIQHYQITQHLLQLPLEMQRK
jgi:hypothetical protein